MITYGTFISELRGLADQIAGLRDAKQMHEDPAFRRWRHELQSLVRQIKDAGYILPSPMSSAVRSFGGAPGWDDDVAFQNYQRDMDDTANELRTILKAYQRDGEPPHRKTSAEAREAILGRLRGAALPAPEKVTLAWLRENVPAMFWLRAGAALVAIIVAVFWLGYAAAKNEFFSKLVEGSSSSSTKAR